MMKNKKLVCFGDSLTKGQPGITYISYLKQWSGVNYGLGGDTVFGVYNRLSNLKKFPEAEACVLFVGANDLYLNHLNTIHPMWTLVVNQVKRRGSLPAQDVQHFELYYRACIKLLKEHYRHLILIDIPCIGELLESELNQQVVQYNRIIQHLSKEFQTDFVDVYTAFSNMIDTPTSYLSPHPGLMLLDQVVSITKWGRDLLSSSRGLSVSVDGIHLNDASAHCLAKLIDQFA
jgi:lysophospholipase L1-like esterase